MAAKSGRTDPSLTELVLRRGFDFEFFQAVRLLAWILPHREPVGQSARPWAELVRFGAQLTLDFPASAVHEITEGRGDAPTRMEVAFFGLTGTQGILPHFYTEYLMMRAANGDGSMAAFLDIFNHRLISMFYRAWEKYNIVAGYEGAVIHNRREPFGGQLFHFLGMGTDGLRGRLPVRDEELLFYAGLIAQQPRSASALRGLLRDYFRIPFEIDQCLGSWYTLEEADRSYMDHDGLQNQLGVGSVAGAEVWDQQARFRVRVGPLAFDQFISFLPGARALEVLAGWVRFFVGPALAFDINLVLKAAAVPFCRLDDSAEDAARLGWTSWLKTDGFKQDAVDVEFSYVS
jgi:type VI secretion system protein ImpH